MCKTERLSRQLPNGCQQTTKFSSDQKSREISHVTIFNRAFKITIRISLVTIDYDANENWSPRIFSSGSTQGYVMHFM